ncbi:peptide-methionine (S)-S-oxide reductase MsrA [Sphingomonas sp. 2R-10]|uniref:peptide-methionine (S)-S-oxide reductase MsrA n=1 Tax=Sphingomonas sp. 2R-10 TaxID=3045148 RepID=UPI000F785F76|nr:peptide-methionine (S)-S-oxide reductase MsrA [Sphingomonas sp. 2R-10]MDJ0276827.1 peptide-methionine (S)-S-oxide reductase MsrA [Sphingomonas sp. 2R-10]
MFMKFLLPVAIAAIGVAAVSIPPATAERAVPIPTIASDVPPTPGPATAVLAGGCFWGMEAVFERVKGVKSVVSGYAGGTRATATYDQVSTERTGHAEAIRITYDPRVVSYGTLLRLYFSVAHDPTQVDGQYPDRGPSYRSAIFAQNGAQALTARRYVAQLTRAKAFPKPIATRIETGAFYPAEAYHQDFARRNPSHPYIVRWDKPKVAAAKVAYPGLVA